MMAFSLLAIVVLGFTVWAHHMFVSACRSGSAVADDDHHRDHRRADRDQGVLLAGHPVAGVLHLDTPMLFALGFLTMFVLGGISGVMLAMIP